MSRQLLVALFALAILAGCETSGDSPDEYGADTFGAGDTIHGSLCGELPADDPRCPLPDIASGDATTPPADSTSAGDSSAFVLSDDGECPSFRCQLAWQQDGWLCYGYDDGLEYFGAPTDDATARSYCDGTWYAKQNG